jgi:HTH-type transcriptional repressor of NAD biosynthesis genes
VIGVIFGKFFPFHNGHLSVIKRALSECEKVFVVVCVNDGSQPSGQKRAYWIQQSAPEAEVLLTEDLCIWHFSQPCVESCTDVWKKRTAELIPHEIDIVYSSESYGEGFSKAISARHVSVDSRRDLHPVSGSQIRSNLADNWNHLPQIVKRGLHRKITILGAESTGTTTLACDLAAELNLPWVAEVGRTVSWELAIRHGGMDAVIWDESVFWRVLREQASAEIDVVNCSQNYANSEIGPWVVCDTDAVATVVWWERYLKSNSESAWKFAQASLADIYVVTDPRDVEFEQDGIRDGEHLRKSMHDSFVEMAMKTGKLVVVASGSRSQRVSDVAERVRAYESNHPRFS